MEFNTYDTAIVMCLRTWRSDDTVKELKSLISFVDYIDHSVLTFSEFETAIHKLIAGGIIHVKGSKPKCNELYDEWWKKKYSKKRVGDSKEIKETKEYLNKNFANSIGTNIRSTSFVSQNEFETALKLYTSN
jgi:hypothetical protein